MNTGGGERKRDRVRERSRRATVYTHNGRSNGVNKFYKIKNGNKTRHSALIYIFVYTAYRKKGEREVCSVKGVKKGTH